MLEAYLFTIRPNRDDVGHQKARTGHLFDGVLVPSKRAHKAR